MARARSAMALPHTVTKHVDDTERATALSMEPSWFPTGLRYAVALTSQNPMPWNDNGRQFAGRSPRSSSD